MSSGGMLLNGHVDVDRLADLFSLEDGEFFLGDGTGGNSFLHEDIGNNPLKWERSSSNGIVNAMAKQIAQTSDEMLIVQLFSGEDRERQKNCP